MERVILLFLLLLSATSTFSQKHEEILGNRPRNNLALNLLGDVSLISINFDRQILISSSFIVSSKVGFGYNTDLTPCLGVVCSGTRNDYLTIPHHLTGNIGKGNDFFEFGIGGTAFEGKTTTPYISYAIIGYRVLPQQSNKINLRLFVYIPFSGYEEELDGFSVYFIGLNIGISF